MHMHQAAMFVLLFGWLNIFWSKYPFDGLLAVLGFLPLLAYQIQHFPRRKTEDRPYVIAGNLLRLVGIGFLLVGFGMRFMGWPSDHYLLTAGAAGAGIGPLLLIGSEAKQVVSREATKVVTFLVCAGFAMYIWNIPYGRWAFMVTFPLFFIIHVTDFILRRKEIRATQR